MSRPAPVRDLPFFKALTDRTGGQRKILRRDYLEAGALPVVDQGSDLIAGYTDDDSSAYNGRLPVVVFGDHTRVFKYVDFPFAIGADGAKVLEPTAAFEPRYLYYYLLTQAIPSRGYSRHFQFLRKISIRCVPRSEQRRIAEILDQADHLRRLRTEANTKADRILPALFLKIFGDPATNSMGWPIQALGELATLGPQYGANARSRPFSPGQPRYVRITDIQEGGRLSPEPVGIELADWEPYRLQDGDSLFARSGATVGKPYIHRAENGLCVFAGYLIRFRLDKDVLHPIVAFAFTQTPDYLRWVESKRRTAAQPNINGQEYASLRIPVPERRLQEQFVACHSEFLTAHHLSRYASTALDRLSSVLLSRAFSGSLTASWREAHMKELLQEMEQQAKALAEA